MGENELIEALRQKGEDRIKLLWEEARKESERLREEMNGRLSKVRAEVHRHLSRQTDQRKDNLLSEARKDVQRLQQEAEGRLAERCLNLAKEGLSELADRKRTTILRALVRETPEAHWRTVRVSPKDVDTARDCFANLEIVPDPTIGAGFVIASEAERFVVDNTLEMRLYRAWPRLLPELLNPIRCAAEDHEPAANDQN